MERLPLSVVVVTCSDGVWEVVKRACAEPQLMCERSKSLGDVSQDVHIDVVVVDEDLLEPGLRARYPQAFIIVMSQDLKTSAGDTIDYVLLKPLNGAVVHRIFGDLRAKRA